MSHIDDLIQRYIDNTASDEERSELMKLIRSGRVEAAVKDRLEEALRTEMLVGEMPGPETHARAEEIFRRILAERRPASKKEVMMEHDRAPHRPAARVRFFKTMRFAAAFLLLGAAGVLLWTQYFTAPAGVEETAFEHTFSQDLLKVVNTGAATRTITLHDGSTVSLEPGSEVRYAGKFDDKREVYLSGNAFFEVTKDASRPFLVYANEVTTKVLGTSFRVKANRGEKEIVVAVKTGKVSVFAKPGNDGPLREEKIQEVTVTPNQQAVYNRRERIVVKKIVEEPEVIKAQPSLKDYYVNAQVMHILQALGESYGVEIRYDEEALAGCTLTSDVIEGEGLYEQLEIVCNALGGRYAMHDDASISIEACGCP